jgi:hypothetical protein
MFGSDFHREVPLGIPYPRSEPVYMTRPVSDAASNSHPVAVFVGRTNIPLASGKGSGSGTILFFGFLSQAKSRSARLDPPEPIRPRKIERESFVQAAVVSAPSKTTPAFTYFQKAISSFHAKQR